MALFTDEYYEFYREIARSAFADMLHDHERNHKYFLALKKAIEKMHERGLRANVLDIGTGTAILSMMAVKCGADTVTACEAFRPMADAAEKIIEHNGMRDEIRVIKKRSTDIRIGDDVDDLWQRANILVTEVFDTELIGEGAIETFESAHRHLLEADCIVVPDSATMYVQVVESPLAWAWNQPKLIADLEGEILLRTPTKISECHGTAELHDIQLNQFPRQQFRELIPPTPVFEFDFSGKTSNPKKESKQIDVQAQNNGSAQVFFVWWVLKMDQEADIRISCAPHWAHEDFERLQSERPDHIPAQNVIPWRDHWMQAVFYNPKATHVNANETLQLQCSHDEFSLWFGLNKADESDGDFKRPLCTCGFHLALSRTRIGQMNDNLRTKRILRILEDEIDQKSVVLFISEGSLIGLTIAALKAQQVYLVDSNKYTRQMLQEYIDFNKLTNVSLIADVDDECIAWGDLTHIIGEPNFSTAILPWDNFYFGDVIDQIRERFAINDSVKILPKTATIEAMPIECMDLHKIIAPFGVCESFDLTIFDKIIESSHKMTDELVEAQPLWEYPNKALGLPKTIYCRDFTKKSENTSSTTQLAIETDGTCNGIAFWTKYHFSDAEDERKTLSTGPLKEITLNSLVDWDMYTRQGIYLYWRPIISKDTTSPLQIPCTVKYINDDGIGASGLDISLADAIEMQ